MVGGYGESENVEILVMVVEVHVILAGGYERELVGKWVIWVGLLCSEVRLM